jgi:hypothetical protein
LLDDHAVHEPEDAGLRPVGQGAEPPQQRIEQLAAQPARSRVGAAGALGEHHLEPLGPPLDQLRDQLRRILQVPVEQHHAPPGGEMHAGGDGRLVPEIPRQVDRLDPRIGGVQLADEPRGIVRAAVVDEKHLPRAARRLQRVAQAAVQLGQVVGLVVNRHHGGHHRRREVPRRAGQARGGAAGVRLRGCVHCHPRAPEAAFYLF